MECSAKKGIICMRLDRITGRGVGKQRKFSEVAGLSIRQGRGRNQ
jgi:hypothetical protein